MGSQTFEFNPDRVAHLEVESWKAYYDHAWLKLLRLVVTLMQEQFRIPFPISLFADLCLSPPVDVHQPMESLLAPFAH